MSRLHQVVCSVIINYTGSCDGPDTENVTRLHRAVWVTIDCRTCQCINGITSCEPMDLTECPTLNCGEHDPITLIPGCCPVCDPAGIICLHCSFVFKNIVTVRKNILFESFTLSACLNLIL